MWGSNIKVFIIKFFFEQGFLGGRSYLDLFINIKKYFFIKTHLSGILNCLKITLKELLIFLQVCK